MFYALPGRLPQRNLTKEKQVPKGSLKKRITSIEGRILPKESCFKYKSKTWHSGQRVGRRKTAPSNEFLFVRLGISFSKGFVSSRRGKDLINDHFDLVMFLWKYHSSWKYDQSYVCLIQHMFVSFFCLIQNLFVCTISPLSQFFTLWLVAAEPLWGAELQTFHLVIIMILVMMMLMIMMVNRMRIIIDHVDRNYISMMIFNSGTDKEDCSSLRWSGWGWGWGWG